MKRPANWRRSVLRWLWAAAIATVIVGSLLPADSAPMRELDRLEVSDVLEHSLAYAVVALLPALHERRKFAFAAAVFAAALGIALEFGQLFSTGRTFEIADIVVDFAGILTGLATGMLFRDSRVLRRWQQRLVENR
jgi:VanZ family protein